MNIVLNQLIVPSTGLKLIDGSIITLANYPGTKWIVHNGWYTYNDEQSMGWYFCSIPDKTILPASEENLDGIVLLSNDDLSCQCPPGPCPPHPHPPRPDPEHLEKFTESLKNELDAAFISVDTIADRNSLLDNNRKLPNGKLVRVNYIDDFAGPKYYRWDANNSVWEEEDFGIDASKYVTNDELKEEVSEQVAEVVPVEVEKSTKEITNIIEQLSSDIEWRPVSS